VSPFAVFLPRPSLRLLPVLAAVLFVSLLAAAPPAAARKAGWHKLSGDETASTEVGLARGPGGRLGVAYRHGTGSTAGVRFVLLNRRGRKLQATDVTTGWSTMNASVDLVHTDYGSGRFVAFWSGIRSTSPSETFDGELALAISADNPISWSAATPAAADGTTGYAGSGIGAAADPNGLPVWIGAWGDSGPDENGYSFYGSGFSPHILTGTAADLLYPEVAVDKTGSVMAAWQSIASTDGGIFARPLGSTGPTGPLDYAPSSAAGGHHNFRFQTERTALAARPGKAGFFIAFSKGYPSARRIRLWKVNTPKPVNLAKGKKARGADNVSIAAAKGGRLWIFWAKGRRYFATRTNKAATKAGKVRSLRRPRGADGTYGLYGEGTGSKKLDLFANVSRKGKELIYNTRVRP
jgi:hypothetical protein